jgi:flavin-binding protein dodecin
MIYRLVILFENAIRLRGTTFLAFASKGQKLHWSMLRKIAGVPRANTLFLFINKHLRKQDQKFMSENVYKKIELIGSSASSIEDAVQNALQRAAKTVHSLRWFEVVETRGKIEDGNVAQWQVTIKVGFTLDE